MTAPDRSTSHASSARLSVGIDVSKAYLEIALLGKEISTSRSMPNGEEGFETLLSWIERQTDADLGKSPEQVHVYLEASGGYQRPVARFLHEEGLTVSAINPRRTSAYANSQLTRSKTDQVDAQLLARFCRREGAKPLAASLFRAEGLEGHGPRPPVPEKESDRLENQIDQVSNPTVTSFLESVLKIVNGQIDQLEKAIDDDVRGADALDRKRELLETIPGIGSVTAALVLSGAW